MCDKGLNMVAQKFPVILAMMLLGLMMAFVAVSSAHAAEELADRVVVNKSERKLLLLKSDRVLREFDIALGLAPGSIQMFAWQYRFLIQIVWILRARMPKGFQLVARL